MKKRDKKLLKNVSLVVLLGLFVGFFLYSGFLSQSFVNIQLQDNGYITEPIKTGEFIFQGIVGTYETTWLGSLTSHGGHGTVKIDGDNDGERKISNTISSDSTLKLSSTNQIISSSQGSTNYIQTKIILPPGKITAKYDYSITDYYGSVASVTFVIGDKTKTFKTPWFHVEERGGSVSGSDTYEIILEEEKEVIFKVETTTESKNENTVGNLEISFEISENIPPENTNPPTLVSNIPWDIIIVIIAVIFLSFLIILIIKWRNKK